MFADDLTNSFDSEADLTNVVVTGDVTIDTTLFQAGTGSLKVAPGGSVIIPVNNSTAPNRFIRLGGLIPAPIQSLTN